MAIADLHNRRRGQIAAFRGPVPDDCGGDGGGVCNQSMCGWRVSGGRHHYAREPSSVFGGIDWERAYGGGPDRDSLKKGAGSRELWRFDSQPHQTVDERGCGWKTGGNVMVSWRDALSVAGMSNSGCFINAKRPCVVM